MTPALQLRIARLTVDAGALGGLSPAQFKARLRAALARELAGSTMPLQGTPDAAAQVAAEVAPQVRARLPAPSAGAAPPGARP